MNLWRWNKGIARGRRRPAVAAQGRAGLGRALRGPAPQGRRHHARDDQRRRHAALAGAAELHHAARLERALRPARQAGPDRVRPRPVPSDDFDQIREGALVTAEILRDLGLVAVREGLRLARHPHHRAAQAHAHGRRGARARGRDRRADRRRAPGHADDVLAQGQARGPDPRRRRAQHLRADDRRALRRAGAARARRSRCRWTGTRSPTRRCGRTQFKLRDARGAARGAATRGRTCDAARRRCR